MRGNHFYFVRGSKACVKAWEKGRMRAGVYERVRLRGRATVYWGKEGRSVLDEGKCVSKRAEGYLVMGKRK